MASWARLGCTFQRWSWSSVGLGRLTQLHQAERKAPGPGPALLRVPGAASALATHSACSACSAAGRRSTWWRVRVWSRCAVGQLAGAGWAGDVELPVRASDR